MGRSLCWKCSCVSFYLAYSAHNSARPQKEDKIAAFRDGWPGLLLEAGLHPDSNRNFLRWKPCGVLGMNLIIPYFGLPVDNRYFRVTNQTLGFIYYLLTGTTFIILMRFNVRPKPGAIYLDRRTKNNPSLLGLQEVIDILRLGNLGMIVLSQNVINSTKGLKVPVLNRASGIRWGSCVKNTDRISIDINYGTTNCTVKWGVIRRYLPNYWIFLANHSWMFRHLKIETGLCLGAYKSVNLGWPMCTWLLWQFNVRSLSG